MPGPQILIFLDKLLHLPYRFMVGIFVGVRQKRSINENKKVVLIKLMGIGSITRIYKSLRDQNADFDQLKFVTLTSNKGLCKVLAIDNVHYIRDKNLFTLSWDLFKLSWAIRREAPGHLINYERGSNLLGLFQIWSTCFTNIRTVSFHDFSRDTVTNFDAIYSIHNLPFQQLIDKTLHCYYREDPENRHPMELVINTKKVIININASDYMPYRKYPKSRFITVIRALHQWDPSLSFHLIGSEQEKPYVDSLISHVADLDTSITNKCGQWSLSDFVMNLSDSVLMITNDSGPMHLGALVGLPMVAIWGPTSHSFFGYDSPQITNVHAEVGCSPCFVYAKSKAAKACNKKIECMQLVDPDTVVDAAKEKLTNPDLFRTIDLPQVQNLVDQSIYALAT